LQRDFQQADAHHGGEQDHEQHDCPRDQSRGSGLRWRAVVGRLFDGELVSGSDRVDDYYRPSIAVAGASAPKSATAAHRRGIGGRLWLSTYHRPNSAANPLSHYRSEGYKVLYY
jgi:hypothetical protein